MSKPKLENPVDESLGNIDVSEMITTRAYEIFQNRGGEHGYALNDWLQAEREVLLSRSEREKPSSAMEPQLEAKAATTTGAANALQTKESSTRGGKKT